MHLWYEYDKFMHVFRLLLLSRWEILLYLYISNQTVLCRQIFFSTLLALIHFFLDFVKLMALEITLGCYICVLIHLCEVHKSWVPHYVGDWTLYGGVRHFQHNYCTSLASSHLSGVLNLEVASRVLDNLWTLVSTITTVLFTFFCCFLCMH